MECKLTQEEVAEHSKRELQKVGDWHMLMQTALHVCRNHPDCWRAEDRAAQHSKRGLYELLRWLLCRHAQPGSAGHSGLELL